MCPRHLRIPGGQDNREDRTHMPMRVNRENRGQPNQPQTECLCALGQRTLYPVCLHAAGDHIAKTKAPISILATGQGTQIKLPDIAAAIRQVRPHYSCRAGPRATSAASRRNRVKVQADPASTPVSRALEREILHSNKNYPCSPRFLF